MSICPAGGHAGWRAAIENAESHGGGASQDGGMAGFFLQSIIFALSIHSAYSGSRGVLWYSTSCVL